MTTKNGGYIIVDLSASVSELNNQLENAYNSKKPVLVYCKDGKAEYMEIEKSGDKYRLQNSSKIIRYYYDYSRYIEINKSIPIVLNNEIFDAEMIRDKSYVITNGDIITVILNIYNYEQNDLTINANDVIGTFRYEDFYIHLSHYHIETIDETGAPLNDYIAVHLEEENGIVSIIADEDFGLEADCSILSNIILI